MRRRTRNYSSEKSSKENFNDQDKYSNTGESEFTRDLTVPFDENEILIERHFVLGDEIFDLSRETRGYSGMGPKGYKRSDERIYEEVCEALSNSIEVDASDIEVSVEHGIVYLLGTVRRREFKRWAEKLIEDISGVVDVKNEIEVETDSGLMQQNRTGLI